MPYKPRLLLTTGDPNGVGPEIILKIFQNTSFSGKFDLTIVGSKRIFDHYSKLLHLPFLPKNKFIDIALPKNFKISEGKIQRNAGRFSGDAIKTAVHLCLKEEFDAMITLPISKESLNLGGYNFPGHTEMLSDLTGSENTVMILHSDEFSVALATGHIPLKDVKKKLSKKLIFNKLITVNNSLVKDFKINKPRIAILSLNPHAGDGGLIGVEEVNLISPVIDHMASIGFNVRGPFASDAFFANKHYQKFDITLSMYHDQGLIPFKMISFGKGVNFTAGLKIIRTSPDHGTAFDIAGTGKANAESTMQAILLASSLC